MSLPSATRRRFGPEVRPDGTLFRLWSPGGTDVALILDGERLPMDRVADGFLEVFAPGVGPGREYAFEVDGRQVADPASRRQAGDVEGRSVVVDPSLFGRNQRLGRPFAESVIAEVWSSPYPRPARSWI